jgi:hypothetical protein
LERGGDYHHLASFWFSAEQKTYMKIMQGDRMALGRAPESGDPLYSQPTMSRLENAPSRTKPLNTVRI